MKINNEVRKLWKEKNKRLVKFAWCPDCSDDGCDNPDEHEMKLMQFAYELGVQKQEKFSLVSYKDAYDSAFKGKKDG